MRQHEPGVAGALTDAAVGDSLVVGGDEAVQLVELGALAAAARTLSQRGAKRIDAIVDGGIQDAEVLRQISTTELLSHGVVLDARLPQDDITRKLTTTTLADMKVVVPGAGWVWPDTLRGMQPGDEALVYADLPEDVAMRVILTGDQRIDVSVPTTPVERPLLERAWVGARIARLTSKRSLLPVTDRDGRDALELLRKQRVDVVLTDLAMPDLDGMEVLARLRALDPSVPVIMVTAHGSERVAVLALLSTPEPVLIDGRPYVGVIVPTAPVPVGGGLLYLPQDWVRPAEMGIEAVTSIYVSMGITSHQHIGAKK